MCTLHLHPISPFSFRKHCAFLNLQIELLASGAQEKFSPALGWGSDGQLGTKNLFEVWKRQINITFTAWMSHFKLESPNHLNLMLIIVIFQTLWISTRTNAIVLSKYCLTQVLIWDFGCPKEGTSFWLTSQILKCQKNTIRIKMDPEDQKILPSVIGSAISTELSQSQSLLFMARKIDI